MTTNTTYKAGAPGRRLLSTFAVSALMALSAACGGGSGGAAPATPPVATDPGSTVPPPPPVTQPAISILAGSPTESGSVDGSGSAARFSGPRLLTIDTAGNLYTPEPCLIRKITPAGAVSRFAGSPCIESATDNFPTPTTLAAGPDGKLFMTRYPSRDILEVGATGALRTMATLEDAVGGGRGYSMVYPDGLITDAAGNVIVSNYFGVRRFAPSGSYVLLDGAATGTPGFNTYIPQYRPMAVDAKGTLYLADWSVITRIDASGKKTEFAGARLLEAESKDGIGTDAHFVHIRALAVDAAGNLYVADSGEVRDINTGRTSFNSLIRKITPAGVVTTIVGTPGVNELRAGSLPGSLNGVGGIALDGKGNLYATSGNAIVKIVLP